MTWGYVAFMNHYKIN